MNGGGTQVEVVVKVAGAAGDEQSPANQAVQACAARLGIQLEAVHLPGSGPESGVYFTGMVNPAVLDSAIEQLLRCDGVEGAYAKPRGEAP